MTFTLPRFITCFSLAIVALATGLLSDPSHAAERRYATGNFDNVRIYGEFDVVIERAQGLSVRAEGDSLLLNRIVVRSSGEVLTIRERNLGQSAPIFEGSEEKGRKRLKIYITAPSVRAVSYQGNGDVVVADLRGEKTQIIINGNGGALVQNVQSESLTSSVQGRATLTMTGMAEQHRASIRGYGGIDAAGLTSDNTNIIAEGPVFAELNVSGAASGLANNGARIFVVGTEQCSIRSASQAGNDNYVLAPTIVRCALVDDRANDEGDADAAPDDQQ